MVKIKTLSKRGAVDILESLKTEEKSFNGLLKDLSQKKEISTRTLSDRLTELEKEGLINREIIKAKPPKTTYELTSKGEETFETIKKLNRI